MESPQVACTNLTASVLENKSLERALDRFKFRATTNKTLSPGPLMGSVGRLGARRGATSCPNAWWIAWRTCRKTPSGRW